MADQILTILDGTGTSKTLSVGQDAGNSNAFIGTTQITDPVTGAKAFVTAANAQKVDGSAVTQPVSGTVTANAGSGTFTVAGTVTANAGTGAYTTNSDITALASAARTSNTNSADLSNNNAAGVHVVVDVTAIVSAPSIVVTIEGKDALSGKYYPILVSAAIASVSTVVLKVAAGITVAANLSVADILPKTWRVSVAHGNGDSITYSVGASLVA